MSTSSAGTQDFFWYYIDERWGHCTLFANWLCSKPGKALGDLKKWIANYLHVYACVCSLSHVRLCDPTVCSLPGSSVHGVFQLRTLEWADISYSRDLPDPGIKPTFLASPALAGGFFTTVPPEKLLPSYVTHPQLPFWLQILELKKRVGNYI